MSELLQPAKYSQQLAWESHINRLEETKEWVTHYLDLNGIDQYLSDI